VSEQITDRIELLLLKNLLNNEDFARKVIPFVQPEFFADNHEKIIFKTICEHIHKYEKLPTAEAVLIQINKSEEIQSDSDYKELETLIRDKLVQNQDADSIKNSDAWLLDTTEAWCKDKALVDGLSKCIAIMREKGESNISRGSIPKIMQDALSVSFDPNVGHSYVKDYMERYEFYTRVEEKLKFDLDLFNKITGGGIPRKSLNLFMAATGTGKSLAMCHLAASYISSGLNVVYITLEMSEEKISQRIDANLLDVPIKDLELLSAKSFQHKFERLKTTITGNLIVKEYPTGSANANHFRYLLNELLLKQSFKPDVVIVDYLNIASSSRIKSGKTDMYNYIKSVAEELRGLAVEFNCAVWSATQTNRQGYNVSSVGLDNISESYGIAHTADLILSITTDETLDKMGQWIIEQQKNRDNDTSVYRRFGIGVDKSKMRLHDLDDSAQENLLGFNKKPNKKREEDDDQPAFDKGTFGSGMKAERGKNGNKSKRYESIEI